MRDAEPETARPAAGRRGAPEGDGSMPRRRPARVVIEAVSPQVEGGRFPAKAVAGDVVRVEADVFADGHDRLSVELLHRADADSDWTAAPMRFVANDRWLGTFPTPELGRYVFTLRAWVDGFESWRQTVKVKAAAKQDLAVELEIGGALVDAASRRASRADRRDLRTLAEWVRGGGRRGVRAAQSEDLRELMAAYPDRTGAVAFERELAVVAERERARFSTWYELFPRSSSTEPGRHGTLRDTADRLSYVSAMGFDVVYLPPIHPIGRTRRRGRNNRPRAAKGDVGSPWAIGDETGGHTAVHPELGTLEDFDALVARARGLGMEIALDLALQCSPDHPWVREHPEWFRHRPDGTIHHAENPPKKYEDIYPLDFDTEDWRGLWQAVLDVVLFWIGHGVRAFRVDNPHTKPFAFWEWLLAEVRGRHPDVLFLSEAFTRPKVMYRLAKLGFSQSYTYFTWRHTREELTEYFTDLGGRLHYFRPNVWPNTPDILNEFLRDGGRPAFVIRAALAATLSASYGVYGPAFELCEDRALTPDREEYLDSEKYQVRQWDTASPWSLAELIARLNRIRRENPALQSDRTLTFHPTDNPQLLAYSKSSDEGSNVIVTVVNLDPHHVQSGFVDLDLEGLGLDGSAFEVHDLVSDARYRWEGAHNYVELDPASVPVHVFRVRHRVRTEIDFETFE